MATEKRQSTGNIPGQRWRLLAHQEERAFEVENQGLFDELVVDDWLHVEKMDTNLWWMRIGDARVFVELSSDGKAEVKFQPNAY